MSKHLVRLLMIPLLSMALFTVVSFAGAHKAHAAYVECTQITWKNIKSGSSDTFSTQYAAGTIHVSLQGEFDAHDGAACGGLRAYATLTNLLSSDGGGYLEAAVNVGGVNQGFAKKHVSNGNSSLYSGTVVVSSCGTATASYYDNHNLRDQLGISQASGCI